MTWTPNDSAALYNIPQWGRDYFRVNDQGHLEVTPRGGKEGDGDEFAVDLFDLIGQIRRRGIDTPVLLRFDGILRARVREIVDAFRKAREEFEYPGDYRLVFPIKVNQQRHLVDALLAEGTKHGMGIEVGSKPELLAVMALYADPGRLIVCNGYKDRAYVETALLTRRLGCTPVLVVEKYSELETILEASDALGIRPVIGVRTRLAGQGSGRWRDSSGDRSKFGLSTRNIVQMVEALEARGMLDCLKLLHFHIGSQITQIRAIKNALREATATLVGLRQLGAEIEYFDVGGGLGIDYDGSRTNFDSSMNYSLQEYANDVVYQTRVACEESGIPYPTIVSESGRALTAHHAVLIAEVIDTSGFQQSEVPPQVGEDEPDSVRDLAEVSREVSAKNYQESYNDAVAYRDEAMTLFNLGQLDLRQRARVEEFFWRTCEKILRITRKLDYVPEDFDNLERNLSDTYFVNFSVFQSLPDSWAIQQLFPVLPIHRLNEEPTRRGVLADVTCDSDGKIDRFIDLRDVKRTLELHTKHEEEPYYLGFFLVGAYQEILGDMHNLFGDTHVVHVDAGEDGRPKLTHVVPGDNIQEVLSYVEYFPSDLLTSLRKKIEAAIDADHLSLEESAALQRRFEEGLASYTYLIRHNTDTPR
ncbi:MAG: biosynthetic arginine decarboxylase [Planctomycetota bacterium]